MYITHSGHSIGVLLLGREFMASTDLDALSDIVNILREAFFRGGFIPRV
jgi:hypothetical protein